MGRMWKVAGAATLLLGLLGAACGNGKGSGGAYGGGAGGAAGAGSASAGASGGYGYGSGGGSSGSSGTGSGGGAGVLTLKEANFQFSPTKITVTSGDTITVSDTNPSTPHTFTVQGTSIDVSNNGQQSQTVTIDLKPGTYAFYCRFHRSLGMTGTLIVR